MKTLRWPLIGPKISVSSGSLLTPVGSPCCCGLFVRHLAGHGMSCVLVFETLCLPLAHVSSFFFPLLCAGRVFCKLTWPFFCMLAAACHISAAEGENRKEKHALFAELRGPYWKHVNYTNTTCLMIKPNRSGSVEGYQQRALIRNRHWQKTLNFKLF